MITLSDKSNTIPITVESGHKYRTEQGFNAVKVGIKTHENENAIALKKPGWLKIKVAYSPRDNQVDG